MVSAHIGIIFRRNLIICRSINYEQSCVSKMSLNEEETYEEETNQYITYLIHDGSHGSRMQRQRIIK